MFQMELTPTKTISSGLLLFIRILYWDIRVHNFLSDVSHFLQTLVAFVSTKWKVWTNMKTVVTDEKSNGDKLCSGELKLVMDSLGILCDPDGENSVGTVEFSALFEVDEPSLEEVKEAFDVFDVNKDGFIDETELHRVLCSLELKEGSQVEQCRRMIGAFDENGDGLIDFNEFVKFMEKCFC